jgi:hypothetical protein
MLFWLRRRSVFSQHNVTRYRNALRVRRFVGTAWYAKYPHPIEPAALIGDGVMKSLA